MTGLFNSVFGGYQRCKNCGKPVFIAPMMGWTHVGILDSLDCEGADAN